MSFCPLSEWGFHPKLRFRPDYLLRYGLQGLSLFYSLGEVPTAATVEVSMDATIAAILLELNNISSSKEEQRMALKAFQGGKDVFCSSPDWLRQEE